MEAAPTTLIVPAATSSSTVADVSSTAGSDKSSMSVGVEVAIIVASIVVSIGVVLLVIFAFRRYQQRKAKRAPSYQFRSEKAGHGEVGNEGLEYVNEGFARPYYHQPRSPPTHSYENNTYTSLPNFPPTLPKVHSPSLLASYSSSLPSSETKPLSSEPYKGSPCGEEKRATAAGVSNFGSGSPPLYSPPPPFSSSPCSARMIQQPWDAQGLEAASVPRLDPPPRVTFASQLSLIPQTPPERTSVSSPVDSDHENHVIRAPSPIVTSDSTAMTHDNSLHRPATAPRRKSYRTGGSQDMRSSVLTRNVPSKFKTNFDEDRAGYLDRQASMKTVNSVYSQESAGEDTWEEVEELEQEERRRSQLIEAFPLLSATSTTPVIPPRNPERERRDRIQKAIESEPMYWREHAEGEEDESSVPLVAKNGIAVSPLIYPSRK
ncbi:hypothetical protein C8Q75DRAFT_774473 [Abortiporus biennis]|nr:hypothetical protein C8Q75DRAFT_774473 [Abortiporus biennis]